MSQSATIIPIKRPDQVKAILSPAEKKLVALIAKIIVDKTINELQLHEKSN